MRDVRLLQLGLVTAVLLGLIVPELPAQDRATRGEDAKQASAELQKRVAEIKSGKARKVYRSPAELLADMPKGVYPKAGEDEGISRSDARKWLAQNLVLRTVEWQATVTKYSVSGDGPYTVKLKTDLPGVYDGFTDDIGLPDVSSLHIAFGDRVVLGGQDCRVTLNPTLPIDLTGVTLKYTCSREEATKLRGFEKKKVTFRAVVLEASVGDEAEVKIVKGEDNKIEKSLPIALQTSNPTIEGFLPDDDAGQGSGLPYGVYTKDADEGLILVLEPGRATVFDTKAAVYTCKYHKGQKLGEQIRLTGPFVKGAKATDGSWIFERRENQLTIREPNERERKVFNELRPDGDETRVKLFAGKWISAE